MPLHPDKLISIQNIAAGGSPTNREPIKSSTVEQRAVNAVKQRKAQALPKDPGSIEDTAFQLRDAHWANHLKRLKTQVKPHTTAPKPTQGTGQPQIVFQLPGQVK